MIRFSALLFLVACVPDPNRIGTPEWSVATVGMHTSELAPTGDLVVFSQFESTLYGADGTSRWRRTHPDYPYDVAVDHDGSVAALSRVGGQLTLARIDLGGQIEYERSIPETYEQARVVIDARRVVWVLFNQKGSDQARWTRFARDGSVLGSGSLGFRISAGLAHPSAGILVTSAQQELFAIGDGGEVLWMYGEPIKSHTAHEDGELTLIVGDDIVRLSADHEERWRRSLTVTGGPVAAVAGGSAVILGSVDSIQADGAFGCLLLVDRDGHVSDREIIDGIFHGLARGAPIDGFRFVTADRTESTLVARRLP